MTSDDSELQTAIIQIRNGELIAIERSFWLEKSSSQVSRYLRLVWKFRFGTPDRTLTEQLLKPAHSPRPPLKKPIIENLLKSSSPVEMVYCRYGESETVSTLMRDAFSEGEPSGRSRVTMVCSEEPEGGLKLKQLCKYKSRNQNKKV